MEQDKLGNLIIFITAGGTPSTSINEYWEKGNISWMSSGEINKKIIRNTEKKITKLGLQNSSTKIIDKNCVLIALAGQGKTRGKVAINEIELCTNQSLAAIKTNEKILHYKYLYYFLEKEYKNIREYSSGDGGRGGLNLTMLKEYIIKLVNIESQKKYASFLTSIDQLIEYKEKLIKQKNLEKDFFIIDIFNNIKYEKIYLSSVIIKNKEKNSKGEIQKVHSISNKNGLVDQTDMFENRVIASDDLSNYYIIRKNAIAYNPSRIDVGSVAIKSDSEPGVISPLYISFYVDSNLYNQFILINWFKARDFHKQASRLYEGSVRNTLSFDQLKYFKIPNIELKKQEGIAHTLSSMDNLIELHKQELEELKQMKKYYLNKIFK